MYIRLKILQVPQKSFGVKDHMEALEAKTSQMYHPPSLNDLVYNFMRDQHMMVRVRAGNIIFF